jgi:hypothetical protein
MEAAPADTERKMKWWIPRYLRKIPVKNNAYGQINTKELMEYVNENCGVYNNELPPILYCSTLEVNGYKDWFLPSQWELGLMCRNLHVRGLGKFNDENYWSSNGRMGAWSWNCGHDGVQVYYVNFMDGDTKEEPSCRTYRVRAARRF